MFNRSSGPRNFGRGDRRRANHREAMAGDAPVTELPAHPLITTAEPQWIETQADLDELLDHVKRVGSFAYDTEFIGESTYFPRLCLVQIGTAERVAVVDAMADVDLTGVWELGRIIQVQQILNNAARDGARIAAQGQIVNLTGSYTEIYFSSGTPNIQTTIQEYLYANGITNQTGLQITFQFLNDDLTVNSSITDPYQGPKNQKFLVSVTIPYNNVRWTNMSLINPTSVSGQCIFQMMVDDPFTLNTTVPGWTP